MDESKKDSSGEPPWKAHGPAKQKWKAEGNYYSSEELARMQKSFNDLVIKPRRRKIYDAN